MTINVTTLLNCVNNSIAAADTTNPLEILQLASAVKDFDAGFVYSVADSASLPPAADNTGRLVYLLDKSKYIVSDGSVWTSDLSSEPPGSSIWAWGVNIHGNVGDGTTTNRSSPVSVVGRFTDWCQVSAGSCHGIGVRKNGTAWSWGFNIVGQLGDGTTNNRSSPVSVVGGFTDWCQISAGLYHSLGVRQNGTAWAWGYGTFGQIGSGDTTFRSSPVSVVGGFTDWCQVSAGFYHSLGVRQNGTAWSWGENNFGMLGNNNINQQSSPVSVVGGFTDWCQVSSGRFHSLGVRTNGSAWAWGAAPSGELGNSSTTFRSSPVSVVGGFTDWCQISAGEYYSLGLRQNGTAWSWGRNDNGRLGAGTTTNRSSPVSVVGGFTDWCQISAGTCHSLGLTTNGTVWSWGFNSTGRLGDGTTTNRSSPVSVVGGFTDWCYISGSAAIRQCPIVKGF
jgi:alpha-tubulin suppressor-like RCC1 family protein